MNAVPSYPADSHGKLRISYSSTNTFNSCPRKFEFAKLYNLTREDTSGHAAAIGHLFHQTLGIWLPQRNETAALEYMVTHYPVDKYKHYSAYDPRSLEACFGTLQAIFSHPVFDQLELSKVNVQGSAKDAIEVPFEIFLRGTQVGNLPLSFIGFIDFIFWDRASQRFIILDLKTTRKDLSQLRTKYQHDEQMLPYSLVLETVLGQKFEKVDVVYLHAFIDLAAPQIEPLFYQKTQKDVQEWAQNLYIMVSQLQTFYKHQWFPRRSNSCHSFGRECSFAKYCDTRDFSYLQSYFTTGGFIAEARPHQPWFTAQVELQ